MHASCLPDTPAAAAARSTERRDWIACLLPFPLPQAGESLSESTGAAKLVVRVHIETEAGNPAAAAGGAEEGQKRAVQLSASDLLREFPTMSLGWAELLVSENAIEEDEVLQEERAGAAGSGAGDATATAASTATGGAPEETKAAAGALSVEPLSGPPITRRAFAQQAEETKAGAVSVEQRVAAVEAGMRELRAEMQAQHAEMRSQTEKILAALQASAR